MADLCALVLHLRALEAVHLKPDMGRAVRQIALDFISRQNKPLADWLHDADQMKPYAASSVFQTDTTRALIGEHPAGVTAWIRLVGLRADVATALLEGCAHPSDAIELDRARWQVERVAGLDPNDASEVWAGQTTYASLWQQHAADRAPHSLSLYFGTPTSFHSEGITVPLPLPSYVFRSLANRWNSGAPLPIPKAFNTFIDQALTVQRYRLETRSVEYKTNGREVGFVGDVTYGILPPAKQHERARRSPLLPDADEPDEPPLVERDPSEHALMARAAGMLAAFGFYSGVGIKTAAGMGMMRPLRR